MSRQVLTMSDYEFVSTGRYICYLEQRLGLEQFSCDQVYSFSLHRVPPLALLARKRRLKMILTENNRKLSVYVGEVSLSQEDGLDVVRSMYKSNLTCLEVVQDHIRHLEEIELVSASRKLGVMQDELPF